jgi:hypothetical protein
MNHFANCTSFDQLRQTYHQLCLHHHPDRGGNANVMHAINADYHATSDHLASPDGWNKTAHHGKDWTENRQRFHIDISEKLRLTLFSLLAIPDLTVTISGYWLWLDHPDADSPLLADKLKALGCHFSAKNHRWYYPGINRDKDSKPTNQQPSNDTHYPDENSHYPTNNDDLPF